MSPTIVTVVCGLLAVISSTAVCMSLMNSASFLLGFLYVLMIVCSGCVLVSSLCICIVVLEVLGVSTFSSDMCKLVL